MAIKFTPYHLVSVEYMDSGDVKVIFEHLGDQSTSYIFLDSGSHWVVDPISGLPHSETEPSYWGKSGLREWFYKGQLHREGGPAVETSDGAEKWFRHGQLHREDGPAIIRRNGVQEWYQHDSLHREDGPAVVYPDGTKEWWLEGQYQEHVES